MEDLSAILIIAAVINLVIIYLFYSKLSSINKEAKKTNYLLHKMYLKDGGEITEQDARYLNG